jgi:hypothetical protein
MKMSRKKRERLYSPVPIFWILIGVLLTMNQSETQELIRLHPRGITFLIICLCLWLCVCVLSEIILFIKAWRKVNQLEKLENER